MNELIKAAQALVDSVSFDVNGKIIGDRWVGGHGGLVSKETLKLADACRRAIEEAKGGGAPFLTSRSSTTTRRGAACGRAPKTSSSPWMALPARPRAATASLIDDWADEGGALSALELKMLSRTLDRLSDQDLSDWDRNFVEDMTKRVIKHGTRTVLSERQEEQIERMKGQYL